MGKDGCFRTYKQNWGFKVTWLYGILGLIFMVIIHEFGHFIVAKILGVGVERFSIGFGPVLFKVKPKKTEYALSLVLLGGYVKLKGESEEEDVKDESDAFYAQPLWKRFLIVLAGPMFNIFSAIIFMMIAYHIGVNSLAPKVGKVLPNSEAQRIGLQKGDTIVAINNIKIKTWREMSKIIKSHPGKPVLLKIDRNGKILILKAVPQGKTITDLLGYKRYVGLLGILPSGDEVIVRYGLAKSIGLGFEKTVYITKVTIIGIVRLIERAIPSSSIGGPIMIVDVAGKAAKAGIGAFLIFIAIISINLGLLNLLPIPVLDGGHLMFYTVEAIKGKPVSKRTQENFQKIGIAILLALMIFAFFNDFRRYGVTKYVENKIEHIR